MYFTLLATGVGIVAVIILAVIVNSGSSVQLPIVQSQFNPYVEIDTGQASVHVNRGQSVVIPLEIRAVTDRPLGLDVWVFSEGEDEGNLDELTTDSSSLSPSSADAAFAEVKQLGFQNGFTGSLDRTSLIIPSSRSLGDDPLATLNLTLKAPDTAQSGDYNLVYAILEKSGSNKSLTYGVFIVSVD